MRWIGAAVEEKPAADKRDNQIGHPLLHQREHSQLLSLLYPIPHASSGR